MAPEMGSRICYARTGIRSADPPREFEKLRSGNQVLGPWQWHQYLHSLAPSGVVLVDISFDETAILVVPAFCAKPCFYAIFAMQ